MNPFAHLTSEGLEKNEDYVGGGYQPLDTDIYQGTVKMIYAGKSQRGAHSLTVIVDFDGKEYREEIYITNREGENFYTKNGKKHQMPGFALMNDFFQIVCDKELHELDFEEKIVKIYNYEERKEIATAVQVPVEALDRPVALAITKELENKKVKVGNDYVPTAETREVNRIAQVFHPEYRMTVNEAKKRAEDPSYEPSVWDRWLKNNRGRVLDKREIKDGQAVAGAPQAASTGKSTAPRTTLFGKK